MSFDIASERVGHWKVIKVAGDLDMASVGSLRRELAGAAREDAGRVAIDLSGLAFIDSSGIGALLAGMKHSAMEGGDFAVLSPGPQAIRVFQAAGLLELLPIYSTREDLPG